MNRRSRHRLSEGPREAGAHHNNGARGYECVCAARKGRSARRRRTLPIGFPRRSSSLSCTIAICLCSCPFNSIWVSYLVFHSLPGSCRRQTFARWLNAAECSYKQPPPHPHPQGYFARYTLLYRQCADGHAKTCYYLLRRHCAVGPEAPAWCSSGQRPTPPAFPCDRSYIRPPP